MGHLRLLFLLLGTLFSAYLLLCLVAPSDLTLNWKGACSESPVVEPGNWTFPLGDMWVEPLDSSRFSVHGLWGEHHLRIENQTGSGVCIMHVNWDSVHWPLLLRGAASLVDVRGEILSRIEGSPPLDPSVN